MQTLMNQYKPATLCTRGEEEEEEQLANDSKEVGNKGKGMKGRRRSGKKATQREERKRERQRDRETVQVLR